MEEQQIAITPWNVFDKTFFKDDSTTQYEYTEYKERNVSVLTLTEYNLINQDLDIPLMIPDSFITVKCNIVRADTGANITTGQVALNNNGFNIFQRAQYYMNDQLIEDLDEAGVSTLVKGLIDYSKGYQPLHNEFWFPDTNFADNNINGLTVYAADGTFLTPVTAAANNSFELVNNTGVGANLANNQALTFYLYNEPINFFINHGTAVQTYVKVLPITAGNIDATHTLINFALPTAPAVPVGVQYDEVKMYLPDGTEVFFFLNDLQCTLSAPGAARFDLVNGLAVVAAAPVYARCANGNENLINNGFIKRQLRSLNNVDGITANKQIRLFLPIKRLFKIFEYNQHIFRGIKHTIRLYKNLNNKTQFMRTSTAQDATLVINDISWWVPTLRPSIEYGLKLDKELNSGMVTKLMWNQLRCIISPEFTSATGAGSQTSWRITSAGNKPVKVYIVFRIQPRYLNNSAQMSYNAMAFDHMNITNINLRINSIQFPKEEFVADFITNDEYSRLYMQYLQMTGKVYDNEGGGIAVSYEEFKSLYPIFCFDLTKQDPQIWANVTQAEMELRYTRSTTVYTTANYTIYAIVEFEKIIQLSGSNNRMSVVL